MLIVDVAGLAEPVMTTAAQVVWFIYLAFREPWLALKYSEKYSKAIYGWWGGSRGSFKSAFTKKCSVPGAFLIKPGQFLFFLYYFINFSYFKDTSSEYPRQIINIAWTAMSLSIKKGVYKKDLSTSFPN